MATAAERKSIAITIEQSAIRACWRPAQSEHAAEICIENGVNLLYTADRDFGRFKALKTFNPLID
jgi:hypothetical protein